MASRNSPARRRRYEELKQMLEERERAVAEKLRSLRETPPTEVGGVTDAEEHAVDAFVQEMEFALAELASGTLRKIDEALRRLEHGRYGICVACGLEIAAARLRAVPFADRCQGCQAEREEVEREAGVLESSFGVRLGGQ